MRKIIYAIMLFSLSLTIIAEGTIGWKEFEIGMQYTKVKDLLEVSKYQWKEVLPEIFHPYYTPFFLTSIFIDNDEYGLNMQFEWPENKIPSEIRNSRLSRINIYPSDAYGNTRSRFFKLQKLLTIKYGKPVFEGDVSQNDYLLENIWVFSTIIIRLAFRGSDEKGSVSLSYEDKTVSNL